MDYSCWGQSELVCECNKLSAENKKLKSAVPSDLYEVKTIQQALEMSGYRLNPELVKDEWDILDYLKMANDADSDPYTIFDWIKDTKMYYPEYLIKETR